MSDEEVVKKYEKTRKHMEVNLSFFPDELARREASRHRDSIRNLTIAIASMTAVMMLATIVNVWLFYQAV